MMANMASEKKHPTELAPIELMDRIISALNYKFLPISIFMDLSKAFDTLDHGLSLGKLHYHKPNIIRVFLKLFLKSKTVCPDQQW